MNKLNNAHIPTRPWFVNVYKGGDLRFLGGDTNHQVQAEFDDKVGGQVIGNFRDSEFDAARALVWIGAFRKGIRCCGCVP